MKIYEKPEIEIILIKNSTTFTDSNDDDGIINLPFDPFDKQ